MPASRRGAALVALILCLPPATARADELLVMPYACAVFGGRIVLTPGPEEGHRVLGPREERRFSACSPVNPGLCRQWTVYRFELDCDGDRVPWVSVVAAVGERSRNARLVDGRLQLRMPPRWGLPPDDPCAEEPDPDARFSYRRMQRYCADRLAMAPAVVEMPPGFAPMLGIDGIFATKPAPKVAANPPPPLPPVAATPRPEGAAPSGPSEHAAQPLPWSDAQVAKEPPAQSPPEKPAADAKPAPKAAPVPAPSTAEAPKAAAPAPQPPPKVALAPPVPAKEQPPTPPKQAAPPPAAEGDGKADSLNVFSALRPATAGAIVVFAGLTLGLIIAFAMARRREHLAHAGMRQRDFASLSFDDPETGQGMPRTRAQALQVLGLAPSANLAAIKKIVDGLRVSWHPDLASDEADRQLRELRSKQINAAWEILQRQRAEV